MSVGALLIIVGFGSIPLGIVCYMVGLGAAMGGSLPAWMGVLLPLAVLLILGGLVAVLIGAGAWFSHPENIHVGMWQ